MKRRFSVAAGAVLISFPVLVLGGIWLFSADEYKAPPARVVPTPSGFEVLGETADGGSGGLAVRYVVLSGPEGVSVDEAARVLIAEMERSGWEAAAEPPLCCITDGELGLLRRGDEWAALDTGSRFDSYIYEYLGFDEIVGDEPALFVTLEYTDWGQGRRVLFP